MYYMICALQNSIPNTLLEIVWKLSDLDWGVQCETKRSKQKFTKRNVSTMQKDLLTMAMGEQHVGGHVLYCACIRYFATERSKHS